ncbi:hypothetical protein QW180_01480 [Vibrio sinaloensis]|nr:hypothetical protein [Vibrio sinaloensis]
MLFELLQRFITYAQTRDEWKVLIGGVEVSNTASSNLLTKLGFAPQQSSKGVVFIAIHSIEWLIKKRAG